MKVSNYRQPIAVVLIILAVFAAAAYYFYFRQRQLSSLPSSSYSGMSTVDNVGNTDAYFVTIEDNSQDSAKSDIYVTNKDNGEKTLFLTTGNVYREHYHNAEYHQGHLYLIKRTGNSEYPSQDWTDELWRYDSSGQATKLFSVQGLTFLTASNEQHIAVDAYDRIIIADYQGQSQKEYPLNQLSKIDQANIAYHKIEAWSQDGRYLWGYSKSLADKVSFDVFRIDTSDWSVKIYNLTSLFVGDEYAINPDYGLFAYSDYPEIYDADTLDQFSSSQKTVTLHVYNLSESADKIIATSLAKKFAPLWINPQTLEYNDPSSDSRLTYPLSGN